MPDISSKDEINANGADNGGQMDELYDEWVQQGDWHPVDHKMICTCYRCLRYVSFTAAAHHLVDALLCPDDRDYHLGLAEWEMVSFLEFRGRTNQRWLEVDENGNCCV